MLRILACSLLCLLLVACGAHKDAAPAKEYKLDGVVVRLDAQVRTAVIKHQAIVGWMEAMTMEFPVRDANEFAKLAPGQHILAAVFVAENGDFWIGKIQPQP